MRLLGFRPDVQTEITDRYVREQLQPSLLRNDELRFIYSARSRDDLGEARQVVSIWDAGEADERDLEARISRPFDCETTDLVADHCIEVLPVSFALTIESQAEASILRLFRGRTRADCLNAYVEEVHATTSAAAQANRGPLALFFASQPPDQVIAISIWSDWDEVTAATGGNVQTPIATHHAERLLAWDATHYEIIPMTVAGAVPRRPRAAGAGVEVSNS